MNPVKTLAGLVQREQYMLTQFSKSLQASIRRLSDNDQLPPDTQSELEQALQGELSWSMANQVELALVDFYDEATLLAQWQRYLAEVHRLPQHLMDFYQQQSSEVSPQTLRVQLSRLVTDLQWQRESRRVIRYHESRMRKNVVAFFLCAFVLFFSPTIFRILFGFEFDNLRLYYIFTAATSGILGAAFSQLTSIQGRVQHASLDQVRAMSQFAYIIARSVVGAGAGLIMFYLIQSGLLNGAFFPEFIDDATELNQFSADLQVNGITSDDTHQGVSQQIESELAIGTLARPAQGLSLLIVWCILAGFSEKMIPGILNKQAKDVGDEKN